MKYRRNITRLKHYDYSSNGIYFVTFCTFHRQHTLSRIEEISANGSQITNLTLSNVGLICNNTADFLHQVYPDINLISKVIMPNHVHALIALHNNKTNDRSLQLSDYIGAWKRKTTYDAHRAGFKGQVWQRSFYEHVVRNEEDMLRVMEYIENNPKKWMLDRFYKDFH